MKKLIPVLAVGAALCLGQISAQVPVAAARHLNPGPQLFRFGSLPGAWWEECEGVRGRVVCGKWKVVQKSGNSARLKLYLTNGAVGIGKMHFKGNKITMTRVDIKMDVSLRGIYHGKVRTNGLVGGTAKLWIPKTSKQPGTRPGTVPFSARIFPTMAGYRTHLPKGH